MISVIIPARNEKYLGQTVKDVKDKAKGQVEVLVGEDTQGKGQRAMINELASKAKGELIMKLDAHCSLSYGFDEQIEKDITDNMVMTGLLCRLDAENWQIIPKPFTKQYVFDRNMVFQYANSESTQKLVETMSLQGSLFAVSKDNYFRWNLCDESWGSWGFQGTEVAAKSWLNGGKVVTNTDFFYGHLFRYPYLGEKSPIAQQKALELKRHPKMKWLVEKFNYPCDWREEKFYENSI